MGENPATLGLVAVDRGNWSPPRYGPIAVRKRCPTVQGHGTARRRVSRTRTDQVKPREGSRLRLKCHDAVPAPSYPPLVGGPTWDNPVRAPGLCAKPVIAHPGYRQPRSHQHSLQRRSGETVRSLNTDAICAPALRGPTARHPWGSAIWASSAASNSASCSSPSASRTRRM